jgi:hypothetical protein
LIDSNYARSYSGQNVQVLRAFLILLDGDADGEDIGYLIVERQIGRRMKKMAHEII